MNVGGNLLLGLAFVMTAVLAVSLGPSGRLTGVDRPGTAGLLLLWTAPRWIALALVLALQVYRGDWSWISSSRLTQGFAVLGVHGLLGVLSMLVLSLLTEDESATLSPWVRTAAGVALIVWPALLIALLAGVTNPALRLPLAPGLLHAGWVVLAIIMAFTHGSVLVVGGRHAAKTAANEQSRLTTATEDRLALRQRELDALGADAPVKKLLGFTGYDEPGNIRAQALSALSARPTLHAELAEILRGPHGFLALTYVHDQFHEPVASLVAPTSDAIAHLAQNIQTQLAQGSTESFTHETSVACGAVARFPKDGVAFEDALRQLRAVLAATSQTEGALEVFDARVSSLRRIP